MPEQETTPAAAKGGNAPNSPFGALEESENLLRFVLLKTQTVTRNGKTVLHRSALKISHFLQQKEGDRQNDGWSMTREKHGGGIAEKLQKYAALQNRNSGDYGYAAARVSGINGILDEQNRRAIIVKEDPQEHDPAHILVFKARQYSEDEARTIRRKLLQKFSEVKTA